MAKPGKKWILAEQTLLKGQTGRISSQFLIKSPFNGSHLKKSARVTGSGLAD